MNWTLGLIVVVAVALVLIIRRSALVSEDAACRYLKAGALIIDVRSPEEFQSGHVAGALNVPWTGMPANVVPHVTNKDQVLLLHCLSGGRSAVAKRRLQASGYTRVFNAGSYGRIQRIVQRSQAEAKGHPPVSHSEAG